MKNKTRMISQFLFLLLIIYVALRPVFDKSYVSDFESYCPFGGISSLMSKLNQGAMACSMGELQVALGIGLLAGVFLIGKLFCSFICPVGTIAEWLGRLGDKFNLRYELPSVIDRPLRSLKYILLFITIYFTMTSSELFCKKYDPYYASANLFSSYDSLLYFAVPAVLIVIAGSIFLRLAWCRYLCPLGAASNIFANFLGGGLLLGIFILIRLSGVQVSYIYLLGALILSGLAFELGFNRIFLKPFPRIQKQNDRCSSCGLCDKKCPQGIKISETSIVNQIDCTLCTDCLYVCPLKDTITISKKTTFKYLSPVAVVVVVLLSFGASTQINFTTIAERWGNYDSVNNIQTYYQAGIKNVKCFSSSMSLKGRLEEIEGVVGLDTWASINAVKIYFDPAKISLGKVKSALFTPIKKEIRSINTAQIKELNTWETGINNLFDSFDFSYLAAAFQKENGIYGFESRYGEPVAVTIYYDSQKTNPDRIREIIMQDEIQISNGETIKKVKLNFTLNYFQQQIGKISSTEYKRKIFKSYDKMFNGYDDYETGKLSVFVFPMPEADIAAFRSQLSSLASHLSGDEGIVRFSTRYITAPMGLIYFDPELTKVEKIKAALKVQKLTVYITDTETEQMDNPFHIKPEGKTLKSDEMKIDDEKI